MNETMKLFLCVLVALALAPVAALAKGPYDGSKAQLCAVTETDGCAEDGPCAEGDADDTRVPQFVRVNVKDKKIEILDDGREGEVTKIESVKRSEGRLILQGSHAINRKNKRGQR